MVKKYVADTNQNGFDKFKESLQLGIYIYSILILIMFKTTKLFNLIGHKVHKSIPTRQVLQDN